MIFQIAGSGGIYPIETNPEIFGMLQPLWPFTYAISGFREAILGPVEANVTADIHALLKVIAVVLPFGLLKKP
ncbi:YhgE/Pip domain-containing protein, partial [Aduncisulcus paluster]